MEAIVLAGGLGTRLQHIIPGMPKPMAPINGRPFLEYVFGYLLRNGVERTILAVGYKAEKISDYFGTNYNSTPIIYSYEDSPLGTGGAILKALGICNCENVIIVNGDTYFDVNLPEMLEYHKRMGSKLTMAVKAMINFDRYGSVIIENNKVIRFDEKKPTAYGKINGGIYIVNKSVFEGMDSRVFSFEKSILESEHSCVYAFESEGYFIDIGVPEDYYKAQKELMYG